MPHQNIFRCRIKRPGPRAGTNPQSPSVGRGLRPRRACNQSHRCLSQQFYPPERERRPSACIYDSFLPVRPLELQPQNFADRLRLRSPSAPPLRKTRSGKTSRLARRTGKRNASGLLQTVPTHFTFTRATVGPCQRFLHATRFKPPLLAQREDGAQI